MIKKYNSESLNQVVERLFDENPILKTKIIETRLIQNWYEVVGEIGKKYTSDIYFSKGILFVNLTSSIYKHEMSLGHDILVRKLNEITKTDILKKIVFR